MKKLVFAGVALAALALGSVAPAEAAGGCGPYGHRGFYGHCRPNGGGFGYRRPFYGHPYGWHRGYGWHRHYY